MTCTHAFFWGIAFVYPFCLAAMNTKNIHRMPPLPLTPMPKQMYLESPKCGRVCRNTYIEYKLLFKNNLKTPVFIAFVSCYIYKNAKKAEEKRSTYIPMRPQDIRVIPMYDTIKAHKNIHQVLIMSPELNTVQQYILYPYTFKKYAIKKKNLNLSLLPSNPNNRSINAW